MVMAAGRSNVDFPESPDTKKAYKRSKGLLKIAPSMAQIRVSNAKIHPQLTKSTRLLKGICKGVFQARVHPMNLENGKRVKKKSSCS